MDIALLGATGFVGRHVARALAERGHSVRCASRGLNPPRDRIGEFLAGLRAAAGAGDRLRVEWFPADLVTGEGLHDLVGGCDGVVHAAGVREELGGYTFDAVHAGGAMRLIDACRARKVTRLVHIGYAGAREDPRSPYHDAKWKEALLIEESRLDFTILRPSILFGAGDLLVDALARALETFPLYPSPALARTRMNPLAVEDLARCTVATLEGERGARAAVNLAGPAGVSVGGAIRTVARALGRFALPFPVPRVLFAPIGGLVGRLYRNPPFSRRLARMMLDVVEPDAAGDAGGRTPFTPEEVRKRLPAEIRGVSIWDLRLWGR